MRPTELVDPVALLMLIAANGVPVLLSLLLGQRGARPIDSGRILADGRPLLGPHKTWRGLAGGTIAAALVGALCGVGFGLGAIFGLLALAGDLLSSFLKRRSGWAAGRETLLLDQLPESLLPLLLLSVPLGLDAAAVLGTTALFCILDVATAQVRRTVHRPGPLR